MRKGMEGLSAQVKTRVLVKRDSRPCMTRDQRHHTNAYIFGAVCPPRDCGVALVLPDSDTYAMNLYLVALGKQVAAGGHAKVIVYGAGWHIAAALRVSENISLLFLSPYSPELNAQENIWQYLRQNFLAGRIFDTCNDIVDACCNAWKALTGETGRIASIATRDWLQWMGS